MKTLTPYFGLLWILAQSQTALADIYRCKLPDGRTVYQEKPCSSDELQKAIDDRQERARLKKQQERKQEEKPIRQKEEYQAQREQSKKTHTQLDVKGLESSEFCTRYGCPKPSTRRLKDGGINHEYKLNVRPSVTFGVVAPTLGGTITSYGLVFYYREVLAPNDLEMIWSLIRSTHPGGDTEEIRKFVQLYTQINVFQIRMAKSTVVGPNRLWAGKVGGTQIVDIERVADASDRPTFEQVGHQGRTYYIVVLPQQAADDRQLLAIAKYLSNEEKKVGLLGIVQMFVWTDKRKAASGIPMTDAQVDAMIAQVLINPGQGIQRVKRL